jgi:hypothetical protein
MVISTKLPIVKNLIEIITLIQMYQNDMKMVLDRLSGPYRSVRYHELITHKVTKSQRKLPLPMYKRSPQPLFTMLPNLCIKGDPNLFSQSLS